MDAKFTGSSHYVASQDLMTTVNIAVTLQKPQLIKGELTSPINPAPGCAFAARCEFACDKCRQGDIPMTKVGEDHYAACVLLEK